MSNKIRWADETVNSVVGCEAGCPWCYARRLAARNMRGCEQCRTFTPHFHPEQFPKLARGKHKRVFVGSMTDFWSPGVDPEWRRQTFEACSEPTNAYLFLTKQPHRVTARDMIAMQWPRFWLGVTITRPEDIWRLAVRPWAGHQTFVSFEPLLAEIDCRAISWEEVPWAISGPQTGPGAKPIGEDVILRMAETLRANGVAVWLKDSCFALYPGLPRYQELPAGMPDRRTR